MTQRLDSLLLSSSPFDSVTLPPPFLVISEDRLASIRDGKFKTDENIIRSFSLLSHFFKSLDFNCVSKQAGVAQYILVSTTVQIGDFIWDDLGLDFITMVFGPGLGLGNFVFSPLPRTFNLPFACYQFIKFSES